MVSGSDEHGTPITVTADKMGKKPQEIVDRFYAEHESDLKRLGISCDCYFRTSHSNHKETAQEFFSKLFQKGLIEERSTQALYCANCSRFLPDRYVEGNCPFCKARGARGDQCDACGKTLDPKDLIDAKCKICGKSPEPRNTRLHYLLLSKLAPALTDYLRSKTGWRPNVINFTENWLKEGLQDRAITRDLHWGVPVPLPGLEGKRLYVWFEAVIGYFSASLEWARRAGRPEAWKEFWQDPQAESYYFIGKDNIPFHAIIWPSILLGHGGLNLPTNVPANEYLMLSGEKFSKSRGIGVALGECLENFDADQIRYYLASIMPERSDADFSWDGFISKNNEEFLSVIGNLANRILVFAAKNFGKVPEPGPFSREDRAVAEAAARAGRELGEAIEKCEFKKGLKEIFLLAQAGNQYFNAQAPWKLAKENPERCRSVINTSLNLCHALAVFLSPYVPATAQKIWAMLGLPGEIPSDYWSRADLPLTPGQTLGPVAPLVKKIERDPASP